MQFDKLTFKRRVKSHLLALVGARNILHVGRIRVKQYHTFRHVQGFTFGIFMPNTSKTIHSLAITILR